MKKPKQILIDYDEYLELEKKKPFEEQCIDFIQNQMKKPPEVRLPANEVLIVREFSAGLGGTTFFFKLTVTRS